MKKYQVTCTETCPTCGGDRIISNPIYAQYVEHENAVKERTGKDFPELWAHEDELNQFWKDRGYPGLSEPGGTPPEEWPCEECNGTGEIEYSVELGAALEELGFRLPL